MSFDPTARIAAFPPATLANLPQLVQQYGAMCAIRPSDPSAGQVKTLLAHYDGVTGQLRAGEIGISVQPVRLTDNRIAVAGHWTTAIKTAWEQGEITADELTIAEMQALMP